MKKKKYFQKISKLNLIVFIIAIFVLNIFVVNVIFTNEAIAQPNEEAIITTSGMYIKVGDKWVLKSSWQGRIQQMKDMLNALNWEKTEKLFGTAGSKAVWSALGTALNTIAYDTATWLGSGGKGQEPMWERRGLNEYLGDITDNAAGTFLEKLGQSNDWGKDFNLCEPDFNVKKKIGLGLLSQQKPGQPVCTFSKMKENWSQELQDPNFLNNFQDMFKPGSSDLSKAFKLQTGMSAEIDKKANEEVIDFLAKLGFKDTVDMAGRSTSPPGTAEKKLEASILSRILGLNKKTDNEFVDAINVFINQLAYTTFMTLLDSLGKDRPVNKKDWSGLAGLFDSDAGPSNGGANAAKDHLRKIMEPDFNVRGDYDILSELTMCPDPNKAGPTNCVIEDKFRKAIQEQITVGNALKLGYLNPNGIFGFYSKGLEPMYNEGYPYRSMIILRKFRIIPVGWEVASQYINDNLGEIGGTKNIEDMINCYSDSDEYGDPADTFDWCKGLVDPNWVLKAPLNYCKREGAGPEITLKQIVGEGEDSEIMIARAENYCADEQTCIKEYNDGSCQFYGYCTEERRKWRFDSDECEPIYNTCQTFRASDGSTASYLKNSLDYCSIDSVGCNAYCTDFDFDSSTYGCTLSSSGDKLYLDNDAKTCSDSEEGCHEFIRTKSGLGVNLLRNSSFEDYENDGTNDIFDVWGSAGSAVSDAHSGQTALQLNSDFSVNVAIGPDDGVYGVNNEGLSLSFYAKNCTGGEVFGLKTEHSTDVFSATSTLSDNSDWQYYSLFYNVPDIDFSLAPTTIQQNEVQIFINSNTCIIDNLKLERGTKSTTYSDYRGTGLIYQKLAPDYLGCELSEAPNECADFVRSCEADEVGCNMFTAVNDRMSVPAKAELSDFCPAECNGFDEYLQSASFFDSNQPADFIPDLEKNCNANAVGCDEFTNLDDLGEGGENREYYSSLRQCRMPDSECAEFYTWEGSSESGYQLNVFSLENNAGEPAVTSDDSLECNSAIYHLLATDPAYNSDCREFYNTSGEIYYHLYSRTITCSDNCHPYRRTLRNILPTIDEAQTACEDECGGDLTCEALCGNELCDNVASNKDKTCVTDTGEGVFCKNGGYWDSQQGCIYMAIPGEGQKCSATQAGCREYTGNAGNNTRIIMNNDFEGSTQDWTGDGETIVGIDNESLMVGGESLRVTDYSYRIQKTVNSIVEENKSYVISFIAKYDIGNSNEANELKLWLSNGTEIATFTPETVGVYSEWNLYKLNIAYLNHEILAGEQLIIEGDGDYFIDNIRLTEISNRYYKIRQDFWNIPEICSYDIYGNFVGESTNLGCEAYSNQEGDISYIHSFSKLCDEEAVGCEIMVDTHNYSNYNAGIWHDINNNGSCDVITEPDCVEVAADNYEYIVYNPDHACYSSEKGCQRLGASFQVGNSVAHEDVYLMNDPNSYDTILCTEPDVGCEAWSAGNSTVYFKDPGDQVCEWRQKENTEGGTSWGWFKRRIKFCDSDGDGLATSSIDQICLSDTNCPAGISCLEDKHDYDCAVDSRLTFGYGGYGRAIDQPTYESIDGIDYLWTGVCSAENSGCTEYIDSLSEFNSNIIFNADFKQNIDKADMPDLADGWSYVVGNSGEQEVSLEPNTLYILSSEAGNEVTISSVSGNNIFFPLDSNNSLGGAINTISVSALTDRDSQIFLTIGSEFFIDESVSIIVSNASQDASGVGIKKAVIAYQLQNGINKTDCNGTVNFDEGCALFAERTVEDSTIYNTIYKNNDWDADLTLGEVSPPLSSLSNNANALIKVRPDRTCDRWLACKSYVKDKYNNNICYDIGSCDILDENGNCSNFIQEQKDNQIYKETLSDISNFSGYTKVSYGGLGMETGDFYDEGFYSIGNINQIGNLLQINNGGFEFFGSNGYPLGWSAVGVIAWDKNKFSVINNPISAQKDGISYPREGKSILKFAPSESNILSDYIDVEPDVEYILSLDMNTLNFKGDYGKDIVAGVVNILTYNSLGEPTYSSVGSGDGADIYNCDSQPEGYGCGPYLVSGKNWTRIMTSFQVGDDTAKIKLFINGQWWNDFSSGFPAVETDSCLHDNVVCPGNIYIDNITIKPALNLYSNRFSTSLPIIGTDYMSSEYTNWMKGRWESSWYAPQTCRLYPENDSLSCNYYEDSGIRKKGWPGYCLEYDRYPGSSNACLLWYPVDKVKGDGFEEVTGYQGKVPVYYTMEARTERVYEYRHAFNIRQIGCGDGCPHCPSGYIQKDPDGSSCTFGGNENTCYCIPTGSPVILDKTDYRIPGRDGNIHSTTDGWYLYDGEVAEFSGPWIPQINTEDFPNPYAEFLCDGETSCTLDHELFRTKMYATKVVETVTSIGQNKYWSGRVYEGSNYTIPDLNYKYDSDDAPFGSIIPPSQLLSVINNPFEWDGNDEESFTQPVYYQNTINDNARAGQPYQCISSEVDDCEYVADDALSSVYPYAYKNFNFSIGIDGKDAIKRIFAKSYGTWEWDGEHYVPVKGEDWSPPETLCTGPRTNGSVETTETTETVETFTVTQNGVDTILPATFSTNQTAAEFYNYHDALFDNPDFAPPFIEPEKSILFVHHNNLDNTLSLGIIHDNPNDLYSSNPDVDGGTVSFTITDITPGNEVAVRDDPDGSFSGDGGPEVGTEIVPGNVFTWHYPVSKTDGAMITMPLSDWSITINPDFISGLNRWVVSYVGGENELSMDQAVTISHVMESSMTEEVDATEGDFCAFAPLIDNIKINGQSLGNVNISRSQFINLTFNSIVDAQQLPLVMYAVRWGDGEETVVSGIEMRDRSNSQNPHSLYHIYSYWDLMAKYNSGAPNINCSSGQCTVTPSVKIKDNWGWCNEGEDGDPCPLGGYEFYDGQIIVTEN